jgi:hypothetical protein
MLDCIILHSGYTGGDVEWVAAQLAEIDGAKPGHADADDDQGVVDDDSDDDPHGAGDRQTA